MKQLFSIIFIMLLCLYCTDQVSILESRGVLEKNSPPEIQDITTIIVHGNTGQEEHDDSVASAFRYGYADYNGTQYTGTIEMRTDNIETTMQYAETNSIPIVIRSYTGMEDLIAMADTFATVQLFMPAGSLNFEEVFSGDIVNNPIIVTGAGSTNNVTGYKIEFFSEDPITTGNLPSYSNGFIAGQFVYMTNNNLDGANISQVRNTARSTGSEGGTWHSTNGYGKIDVDEVMSVLPVELTSFTGKYEKGKIYLHWETATEVNNYGFEVQRLKRDNSWKVLGFVEGHGNSNSPKYYSYVDTEHRAGLISYRLKQVDIDGGFENFDLTVKVPKLFSKRDE